MTTVEFTNLAATLVVTSSNSCNMSVFSNGCIIKYKRKHISLIDGTLIYDDTVCNIEELTREECEKILKILLHYLILKI